MPSDNDMVELSRGARALWGKTDRLDGQRWLPLYVHMADSMAMAERLWDHWLPDGTRALIARNLGDETLARRVYLVLAGAHDIGKATPVFQSKPIRFDVAARTGQVSMAWMPEHAGLRIRHDFGNSGKPTHTVAGQVILERYLIERYGWTLEFARSYASVVGGHHGTPPDAHQLETAQFAEPARMGWDESTNGANGSWESTQRELLEFVMRRAGVTDRDMTRLGSRRLDPRSESLLTGAVIMADWMASNSDEEMFPLVTVPGTLGNAGYDDDVLSWEGLRYRAERAWHNLRMCNPWRPIVDDLHMDNNAMDSWFRERFNLPAGASLRPMQRETISLASETDDPGLIIIEAPMGEGKTEASLAAAELLARRTGRGGVCIALPTMATTDAMFGRAHAWIESLPVSTAGSGHDAKTVWLAHGKARLNEEFQGVITASRRTISSINQDETTTDGNMTSAETTVSVWMWGRKRGVLANFLICTIDQVLMGALQMKHVVLRQLALANKVVIIDECHAYDAYMQEYLKRILEWLGGFHTPVVLLSATLPEQQRRDMAEAYVRGRAARNPTETHYVCGGRKSGIPIRPGRGRRRAQRKSEPADVAQAPASTEAPSSRESVETAYPLITYSSGTQLRLKPVKPSGRSLRVTCDLMSDDDDSLVALVDDLLQDGGCLGVICDTVARAQHAALLLAGRYGADKVKLTHSRFMDMDRMDNERGIRGLLGPQSTRANGLRPERLIVVGTQVLEQSLDIDFDALISDIAPVDLLMQRLGRVHRHIRGVAQQDRPERLRTAYCHIRGVAQWDDDGPRISDDIQRVYEPASLLEALGVLGLTRPQSVKEVFLPEDIASMVRRAYGEHVVETIPESWRSSYGKAVSKRTAGQETKCARAHSYLLKSLSNMIAERDSLVDWFKSAAIDDANDDKGQRAVRDTQETVEVVLLRRVNGGVHLLPWIGDRHHDIALGAEVPTDSVPSDCLALLISQCSVRLPASMGGYDERKLDALIDALERGCDSATAMWADSPWLAGELAILLEDDGAGVLSASVNGYVVRYDRDTGLSVK
ncbi:CRISPR-associated endonuclease Cas3'' [Bifidobacterium catulorum]|uniref:CRISPR-associated endonuclease Cas3 n=1 Tax=Bifidobacterium catulorum TaxID=1630173 RepID=A0A2U2MTP2_9BIFI|nr:CRISPR-associated endonuclease Cas3'' [Bifidobacterium catulorum]PWG60243.1 CRISPR-associated endonuclease Cas3'' [Bifidobacterium catulorum]